MPDDLPFADANLFLDVARKRRGWKASAAALAEIKKRNGFVSSLTVAIVYFIKLRTVPALRARHETRELIRGLRITGLTPDVLDQAFQNESIEDFEDAIQFYSAKAAAGVMVTRNKRDYAAVENEIEILTPEEFLTVLGSGELAQ